MIALMAEDYLLENPKKLEKLSDFGLFWDIIVKPPSDPKDLWKTRASIIWLFGKKLKFKLGIYRSYRLNVLKKDGLWGISDSSWPHIVIYDRCPMVLCIDEPLDDIAADFVKSANRMIYESRLDTWTRP